MGPRDPEISRELPLGRQAQVATPVPGVQGLLPAPPPLTAIKHGVSSPCAPSLGEVHSAPLHW